MTTATVAVTTGSGRGLSLGGHVHWFLYMYSSLTERVQTDSDLAELEDTSACKLTQCNATFESG